MQICGSEAAGVQRRTHADGEPGRCKVEYEAQDSGARWGVRLLRVRIVKHEPAQLLQVSQGFSAGTGAERALHSTQQRCLPAARWWLTTCSCWCICRDARHLASAAAGASCLAGARLLLQSLAPLRHAPIAQCTR